MGRLVFVTGGARSGKSQYAESTAGGTGAPVVYLATMEAGDDELRSRIARHRARRDAGWRTVEEPRDLARALSNIDPAAPVLLDCLSLWVSNILLDLTKDGDADTAGWEAAAGQCLAEARALIAIQRERAGAMVAVSNEVGMGIVPLGVLARNYRDTLGLVNQAFASAADEAVLMVSGLPLHLK